MHIMLVKSLLLKETEVKEKCKLNIRTPHHKCPLKLKDKYNYYWTSTKKKTKKKLEGVATSQLPRLLVTVQMINRD